jgi:hypothetical protein
MPLDAARREPFDSDRERRIEAATAALLADDAFRATLLAMALQVIGDLDDDPTQGGTQCA